MKLTIIFLVVAIPAIIYAWHRYYCYCKYKKRSRAKEVKDMIKGKVKESYFNKFSGDDKEDGNG